MISRTGYTGERGYEIFCKANDVGLIWDSILEKGASMGIIPAAFSALDMLRVESYLLFYPYDNSEMHPFENEAAGDTLWELGLDSLYPKIKPSSVVAMNTSGCKVRNALRSLACFWKAIKRLKSAIHLGRW